MENNVISTIGSAYGELDAALAKIQALKDAIDEARADPHRYVAQFASDVDQVVDLVRGVAAPVVVDTLSIQLSGPAAPAAASNRPLSRKKG